MAKRRLSETSDHDRHTKRSKADPSTVDRISNLSHEIILRVLSFLPVPDLIVCHRLSRHFRALAGDSQLWKALYYNRYVRPRASRIPGIRDSGVPADSLHFSSKLSKWLDEESLVRRGQDTNWKRQYKLRHNWSKGCCAVSEVPVSEQPSVPPILVQMHESIVYLADQTDGLRAWTNSHGRTILASIPFHMIPNHDRTSPPTALAIDTGSNVGARSRVVVGFQDGSFSVYELDLDACVFVRKYSHPASSNGMLGGVAISSPYLATMTANQLLSLYKFKEPLDGVRASDKVLDPPRLLHSLHSHTVWPPHTLSIRPSADTILVSIAYALPTYLSGWTVGIQEMRMSADNGELVSSRLASAIDPNYRPLTFSHSPSSSPSGQVSNTTSNLFATYDSLEANQIHSKPTSLSYTHPYLLVSHPDNTLTLYLVSSTTDSLSISSGSRLWGHTSSVSGAHVGGRGKAVSVTSRGDELRVWELEGGFTSAAAKRRLQSGELSVSIRPERLAGGEDTTDRTTSAKGIDSSSVDRITSAVTARGNGLGLALEYGKVDPDETSMIRGWIGFDEENVVVLKEKSCGGQSLVVYDFA